MCVVSASSGVQVCIIVVFVNTQYCVFISEKYCVNTWVLWLWIIVLVFVRVHDCIFMGKYDFAACVCLEVNINKDLPLSLG